MPPPWENAYNLVVCILEMHTKSENFVKIGQTNDL